MEIPLYHSSPPAPDSWARETPPHFSEKELKIQSVEWERNPNAYYGAAKEFMTPWLPLNPPAPEAQPCHQLPEDSAPLDEGSRQWEGREGRTVIISVL